MTKSNIVIKQKSFTLQSTANNEQSNKREAWGSPVEFFLSCLGYAIGYGNVWRFPYLCFKNGGAVFLIPYMIMLFCAGLPLFFMELVLGQYASLGPTILFESMAPILSGVGYGMLMISFLITVYYNMIFAWTIFYFVASFTSVLPWSHCNNDFNSINCYSKPGDHCLQNNLTFYNNSCLSAAEACRFAGYLELNNTHCVEELPDTCSNDTNCLDDANFVQIGKSLKRISAGEDYYKNRVLKVTGRTWEDMGSMNWEIAGYLGLGWAVIAACSIKGVKSSGKVVYFTTTFPYLVMIALFVRGIKLEGYYKGVEFYILKVDWSKLFEIEVWNDAATQIFYSLGSSAGALITLSSYNQFKNNCMRDSLVIAACNSATSIFSGFVIFMVLGFMAEELGVEIKDVVNSGSGLVFVAYPEAVASMPLSWLWSLLFFAMLMSLGISSQLTYFETLSSSIYDKFENLRPYKPILSFVLAFILFLCGLTMCLEGGAYMIELFVWYSSGISLVTLGLLEIIFVQYIFGYKKMMVMIKKEMDIYMPPILYTYWSITWLVITPLSLIVIVVLSVYFFVPAHYSGYVFPSNIQALGWFMCSASLVTIPIGAIVAYYKETDKSWNHMISPTELMCPASRREHLKNVSNQQSFKYTYDNRAYQET